MTGVASEWDRLVAAGVLGTTRARPEISLPDGLAEVCRRTSPPRSLLAGAAALSVYRWAGCSLATQAHDAPGAGADPGHPCGPAVGAVLRLVIEDYPELLPEALSLIAERGRHVPHTLLTRIMSTQALPAVLVRRAIGPRGRWLASLRKEWGRFAETARGVDRPPREVWLEGSALERAEMLHEARRSDPALGRELVESTWEDDPPEQRARFVLALRDGLSPDDEPLLERALADARKPVRTAAAQLLSSLPGSAFCGRMRERAAAHIQIRRAGKLRGGVRLKIDPPAELSREERRDGIELRERAGLGKRAGALADLVSALPLDWWTAHEDATVEALIAGAGGSEWEGALSLGWSEAAARQGNHAWAAAMLAAKLPLAVPADDPLRRSLIACVARSGDDGARLALVGALGKSAHGLAEILCELPGVWSVRLSRAALDRLARVIDGARTDVYRNGDEWRALRAAAERIDPGAAAHARRLIPRRDTDRPLARAVDDFHTVLETRERVRLAIEEDRA